MVNAIFCAHGKLACAMLESVQMVYGDANVEAVAFVPGENASDIVEKLKKLVSIHTGDEWLIAVDLQCGSPGMLPRRWRCTIRRYGSLAGYHCRWRWSW